MRIIIVFVFLQFTKLNRVLTLTIIIFLHLNSNFKKNTEVNNTINKERERVREVMKEQQQNNSIHNKNRSKKLV